MLVEKKQFVKLNFFRTTFLAYFIMLGPKAIRWGRRQRWTNYGNVRGCSKQRGCKHL